MVGGNDIEGRIEIRLDGNWTSICSEEWDDEDANVTCQQLGHISGRRPRIGYEGTTSNIWMRSFNCTGQEDALTYCASMNYTDTDTNTDTLGNDALGNDTSSGVSNHCARQEDFASVKCFSGELV